MLLWDPNLYDRMADDGDYGKVFQLKENLVDLPPGKAQLPLFGVILCCTSIPPEQRVSPTLRMLIQILESISSWLYTVRSRIGSLSHGRDPQI